MLRLVHVSDLHPNAACSLAGKVALDEQTGQTITLTDLRRSLECVISFATDGETRCDAVMIPGDLFDSPRPHANEVRVIREAVVRLAQSLPVICCAGNHDVSHNPADASALECLKGLPNVYVMERPTQFGLLLNGHEVQFFGLPYPRKSGLLASEAHADKSPEEITALVNQGLAAIVRSLTAAFQPGALHVLLAHGSVANAQVGAQPRSIASDILIPLEELEAFDFTALGHIHRPQQVGPTAWYSGSLLRLDFSEEREPKGFNLIELCQGRPPHVQCVENPHARQYKTLTMQGVRELEWQGVSAEHVYRIKDTLSPAEYDQAKPLIDRWCGEHPWTQVEVELATEARARDAGMANCLSAEEALARALDGKIDERELPSVMEKHVRLMQEISA